MQTLSSREVYRNAWLSVREDRIRRDDGSEGIYGVVEKDDFAVVIPREPDGSVWLVEQFRYPVGFRTWEFPQGGGPAGAEGTPEQLAVAELREETGLTAGSVRHLGHLYAAYGFCDQGFDVYLATDLSPGPPAREATEQDMRHRRFTADQFEAMVRDGSFVDGPSLAALSLLTLRG